MMSVGDKGGVEEKKEDYGDSDVTFSPSKAGTAAIRNGGNVVRTVPIHPSATMEDDPPHPDFLLDGDDDDDEQRSGFQAQWHAFAKKVFGSCGSAIEAAAYFMQQQGCRWPGQACPLNPALDGEGDGAGKGGKGRQKNQPCGVTKDGFVAVDEKPPLSIADELRRIAAKEGKPFPATAPRPADIPKFLGEEAVCDFDDDNISALSQNTLEEVAQRNAMMQRHYNRRFLNQQQDSSSSDNQTDITPPSPTRTQSMSSNSSDVDHQMQQQQIQVQRLHQQQEQLLEEQRRNDNHQQQQPQRQNQQRRRRRGGGRVDV